MLRIHQEALPLTDVQEAEPYMRKHKFVRRADIVFLPVMARLVRAI
jgi:hypothetical protein